MREALKRLAREGAEPFVTGFLIALAAYGLGYLDGRRHDRKSR